METSNAIPTAFGIAAGNFDGAGMSWGALQFNFGQTSPNDTLSPIWKDLINEHPAEVSACFTNTADYNYWKDLMLNGTYDDKKAFGTAITDPANDHKIIEPWKTYFMNLGLTQVGQDRQVEATDWYWSNVVTWKDQFGLWSRRGCSCLFDISVNKGGIAQSTKDLIYADFNNLSPTLTRNELETEKMRIIANRRADATGGVWMESERARRLAIANGSGYVHGGYDWIDTEDYDLLLEPAFESDVIVIVEPPPPVTPTAPPIIEFQKKPNCLYIFNSDEILTAVLEQGDKASAPFFDGKIKRVLNGERILTFTAPYDNDSIKTIENGGYIAVQNKYKKWELFVITETNFSHDEDLTIDVTAEASHVELDGAIIEDLDLTDQPPSTALPMILQGTRWEAGTITGTTPLDDLKIQYKTVLQALQIYRDFYSISELIFHVEISGNRISRRLVDYTETLGVFKGKRFEYSKDLVEISRTVDTKGIKTALYGIGNLVTTQETKNSTTQTTSVSANKFTTTQKNPTSTANLDTFSWAGSVTESISNEKPSGLQSDITRSFKATLKTKTSSYMVINTANAKTTILEKKTYTFSCYVKCNQAKTLSARIEFQKNNTSFSGGGYSEKKFNVPRNTWQRISVTTKSPATANQVFGEIRVYNAVVGTTLQWAAAKLEEGPLTGLYPKTEVDTTTVKQDIPPDLQRPVTFEDITWTIAGGSEFEKPDGQIWLGDENARLLFGVDVDNDGTKEHIFGIYNVSTDDPIELINETEAELKRVRDPLTSYKGKVVDLFRLMGLESETIDLGDICSVIDTDLGLTLQARLIEELEDLDNPENSEITLGNFLPSNLARSKFNQIENLTERVNALDNGEFIRRGEGLDPSWLDTEFQFARDSLISGGGTVIMNEGDGILIVDDPTDPQKAIKLVAGQLALANSRDLTTGEFNWQAFGTGEGFLASLVETRKLKFDDAQGGTLRLGGLVTGYEEEIRTETINWADKSNNDGDNTRRIFYTGSYATEQAQNVITAEVFGGYEGALAENDGQVLYHSITNNTKLTARYIRDTVNGSTVNANAYWNNINVFVGGTDIAWGKVPTSNGTLTNGTNITDGSDTTYAYVGAAGSWYAQIDLGSIRTDIDSIRILHYYLDGRTFHGTKTEISSDGTNWTTLFDSAVSGEYAETSSARSYTQTNIGTPVGNHIQFVHKFVVGLTDLDSVIFTATGIAGQPFSIKAWNFTTGAWSTTLISTYSGAVDRERVTLTIDEVDFPNYLDPSGNVYFSIYSTNALTSNSTFTFSVDFTKLDKNYFVQTVPIFQNGKFQVLDGEGDIIADLDGQTGGFTHLYIADLDCPNVVPFEDYEDDYYLYVAEKLDTAKGVTGVPNDDNDGLTWGSPLKTVSEALRRVPLYFNGNVFIILASGHTFYEYIVIKAFGGNGSLTVDGQSMASTKIIGNIDANRSNIGIYLKNFTINGTDSYSIISMNNAHVECDSVKINGVVNNGTQFGFDVLYRGYGKLTNCEVYSCQRGVRAGYGGTAHLISGNKGYGSASGLYVYGGFIHGSGTAPAGVTNSVVSGGGTIATFTFDSGAYVIPVPPETTKTITSTSGGNYSSGNGWQLDYVKQGNYGYGNRTGAWFFANTFLGAIGTGKTIKKIRIWISRVNGKGSSTPAKHSIRYHTSATRPSGNVSVSPEIAAITLGWNASGWATVSSSYHTAFANGTAKGIGIYRSDGSYYSACKLTCKVEITYS